MKKLTVVLISFLFVSVFSFAQTTSIGFFGGANFSSINGTYHAHGYGSTLIKSSTGMQFGLIFDYPLTESLSLYSDPSYIKKGFKYENDTEMVGGPGFHGENKFQYIQLPLTLKLKLFKSKVFYIRSGLYMSFLLNANITDEFNYAPHPDNPPTEYTDEEIKDQMNPTTLGFVMGMGADIPLSDKLNLIIDASYMMDISDAMKDTQAYYWGYNGKLYQTVGNVRNRSFVLSAGLAFKI